jgi:hypothetical protein
MHDPEKGRQRTSLHSQMVLLRPAFLSFASSMPHTRQKGQNGQLIQSHSRPRGEEEKWGGSGFEALPLRYCTARHNSRLIAAIWFKVQRMRDAEAKPRPGSLWI